MVSCSRASLLTGCGAGASTLGSGAGAAAHGSDGELHLVSTQLPNFVPRTGSLPGPTTTSCTSAAVAEKARPSAIREDNTTSFTARILYLQELSVGVRCTPLRKKRQA